MTQINSEVKRRSGKKTVKPRSRAQDLHLLYEEKYLEEVLGALLANTTSGREPSRDCKALDPWGKAARRSNHIVELKTSAK